MLFNCYTNDRYTTAVDVYIAAIYNGNIGIYILKIKYKISFKKNIYIYIYMALFEQYYTIYNIYIYIISTHKP